jgi:hypothetical protein
MSRPAEASRFASVLRTDGLRAALAYLNSRTPHRCTAVYRYDGDVMRSMATYDRSEPEAELGPDVAVADAYCGKVAESRQPFQFTDMRLLDTTQRLARNPIVCYCGVLIRDAAGAPWGTLCHYDFQPCQMRTTDIPLLEAVAPMVYAALTAPASPSASSGQRGLTSKA